MSFGHSDRVNPRCHGTGGSIEEGADSRGTGKGRAGEVAADRRDRFSDEPGVRRVRHEDRCPSLIGASTSET